MKKLLIIALISLVTISCQKKLEAPYCPKPLKEYQYKGVHIIHDTTQIPIVKLDEIFTLSNTQSDYWLLNDLVVTVNTGNIFLKNQKIGVFSEDSISFRYTEGSIIYTYNGQKKE